MAHNEYSQRSFDALVKDICDKYNKIDFNHRCTDCGIFLKKEKWTRIDSKVKPFCVECKNKYEDIDFL